MVDRADQLELSQSELRPLVHSIPLLGQVVAVLILPNDYLDVLPPLNLSHLCVLTLPFNLGVELACRCLVDFSIVVDHLLLFCGSEH